MGHDVEVLHYQPNYKVGDHLALTGVDGRGPAACKVAVVFFRPTAAACADISDV